MGALTVHPCLVGKAGQSTQHTVLCHRSSSMKVCVPVLVQRPKVMLGVMRCVREQEGAVFTCYCLGWQALQGWWDAC